MFVLIECEEAAPLCAFYKVILNLPGQQKCMKHSGQLFGGGGTHCVDPPFLDPQTENLQEIIRIKELIR